jgi:hypothetical protein
LAAADQFDRGLVGLGARVGEEDPPVPAEKIQQALGQLDLALVQEQVGGVGHLADLAGHRLDQGRVGVTERAHRDPREEVQVLAAFRVPDPAALPSADRHRRHAVIRHQRGLEPLLQGFRLTHG